MPRTRSRPKTEQKFQNAVLKLVADEGCSALGINAVAQLAGADKVLIYRYFGDFNGLLELVAESRQWLPTGDEILQSLREGITEPFALLQQIADTLSHHIRADASTHQLVRWRRTKACPLCLKFTEEWRQLWQSLPRLLTQRSGNAQRSKWEHACALLALILEAELCDEVVDRHCLQQITDGLEDVQTAERSQDSAQARIHTRAPIEESLPTNLL